MKNVDSPTRSKFFTNSSATSNKANMLTKGLLKGNNSKRQKEIDITTKQDASVKISDAIKDFARIKKTVDLAPEIDNSEKIARLKKEIQAGTYKVNYEAIADKILEREI